MRIRIFYPIIGLLLLFSCQPESKQVSERPDFVKTVDSSFQWKNYDWFCSHVSEYEYDRSGHLLKATSRSNYGDEWGQERITKYFYGSRNMHTATVSTQTYGDDSTSFFYNEFGHKTKVDKYQRRDSIWEHNSHDSLVYNESGLLVEEFSTYLSRYNYGTKHHIQYSYNESDQLIEKIAKYSSAGRPDHITTIETNYDLDGRLDSRVTYFSSARDTIINGKEVLTYDDNGNAIETRLYSYEGDRFLKSSTTYSSFDDNGNRVDRVSQRWINGLWVNTGRVTTKYRRL